MWTSWDALGQDQFQAEQELDLWHGNILGALGENPISNSIWRQKTKLRWWGWGLSRMRMICTKGPWACILTVSSWAIIMKMMMKMVMKMMMKMMRNEDGKKGRSELYRLSVGPRRSNAAPADGSAAVLLCCRSLLLLYLTLICTLCIAQLLYLLCVPLIHVYLLQDAVLLLQCNAAVLLLYTAFIRPSLIWCLHIYVLFSKMLFFATQMTLLLLFFNSSDAFFVLLLAYFYFYVAFLYVYWLFWCDSLLCIAYA